MDERDIGTSESPAPARPDDARLRVVLHFMIAAVLLLVVVGYAAMHPLGEMLPISAVEHRVRINHAGPAELQLLPGIGVVNAAAVVSERERGGLFRSPTDLQRVHGIGPITANRVAPHAIFD